ncbi:MAG: hypothetical protein HQ592_09975 [Planctomycetes bacterium]|nr:hypothetical protein [Planctomycetota bacterium]
MNRTIIFAALALVSGLALGLTLKVLEGNDQTTEQVVPRHHHVSSGLPRFKPIGKGLPHAFDILLPVKAGLNDLRVALNVQDEKNYYLVGFSDDLTIVKVENGVNVPLATAPISSTLPDSYEILIKRRSRDLIVSLNGTVFAAAYDGTFHRGTAEVSTTAGLDGPSTKIQPIGDIHFADDFMKGTEDASLWEEVSGTWRVSEKDNSGLSSNAFFYTGRAPLEGSAISTAGYWFWENYAFEASGRAEGNEYMGLCFYYRDPNNYFLFRWNGDKDKGIKQLVKISGGQMQVLAEEPGGYSAAQWYKMEVRVNRTTAKTLIDDNLIFTVNDAGLAHGKIGLYNNDPSSVRFDDVLVRTERSFAETFTSDPAGGWQFLGGKWQRLPSDAGNPAGNQVLRAEVSGKGKALTGNDDWHNYTVKATVANWRDGAVGLPARYRDEANHYLYLVHIDGTHQLARFHRGVRTVLAEKKLPVAPDDPHELFFRVDGNVLTAGIDGLRCFEEWASAVENGRAGLYASGTGRADFDNVSVTMAQYGDAILTTNEVFEHEKTMANWASPLRDWLTGNEQIDGKRYELNWHRADFPGDVEIRAKLDAVPPEGADIRLVVCAEEQTLNSGYSMSVRNADGLTLELFREGRPVARETVKTGKPGRVSLQRKGSFVIGLINFEPVVKFKDDSPLSGITAGIAHTGVDVPKENIEVYCPNVHVYTFGRAGSDWRVARGAWQVTSRWQCDKRWSFFSGVSKQDAILWSKRVLRGDVTLEFAAGIKMDNSRGGKYEYASDINATICADGKDLNSGYSFMYGGWKNSVTSIVRGNTSVAESKSAVIPNNENIHRRWFYIKIRKRGSKLQYFIDNRLVLEFDDSNPLAGNRLAVWTHDNGIMVAKVRVSCANDSQKESPDFKPPGRPKTPYATQ